MLKKILALTGVAVIAALLVPSSASADQNDGVLVIAGGATVGDTYATSAPDTSPTQPGDAEGLCFPGFEPTSGGACVQDLVTPLATDTQEWEFNVPGTPLLGVSTCLAAGVFAGTPVTPSDPISDPDGNCTLQSDGDVFANPAGVGPSCGMSGGDTIGGGSDYIDVGSGQIPIFTQWRSSAGGTLVLDGWVGNANHPSVGLVQARPLPPEDCRTDSAQGFNVVGVFASKSLD